MAPPPWKAFRTLTTDGHDALELDAGQLRAILPQLATTDPGPAGKPTYLVAFAADVVVPLLSERGPDRRTGMVSAILALAAGGILALLADTMFPEAFEHGGRWVALVTAVGFACAFLLSQLTGSA
jgi:hypothetical protein